MKTLLFLNSAEGSQYGIEDGFTALLDKGTITELKWFYFEDYSKKNSVEKTLEKMYSEAKEFNPELIVLFHVGRFPINESFITNLKKLKSKPIIAYDEGDMYGGWSKPITNSMKLIFKYADVISIRGLGKWYNTVKKYNKNIIYTPHSNSLYRYTKDIKINTLKKHKIIFVGNRIKSRLGRIRRLPGAYGREKFVNKISYNFINDFKLNGKGWENLIGNQGKLDFIEQSELYSNSLIHLSYEHYPSIPYYFSDRLPIALASGQIYVCHFHEGYDKMFKDCDFIYFFQNENEAIDIINYLNSLNIKELILKSMRAKEWADNNLSPIIVWSNFYNQIIEKAQK